MSQAEMFTMPCYLAHADCLEFLKQVPDNFFDSCVTDAPYEIGLLGNDWDKTGIAFSELLWREVHRVLKPGARLICFAAPKKYHRVACSIEDAGFQIDDMHPWLKGGANMPKGNWVSPAIDKHLGATREVVGTRTLYGTAALSIAERGGTHSVGVSGKGRKKDVPVTVPETEEAKRWEGWHWQLKPAYEPACIARKPAEGSAVASLLKWGTGALNVMGCAVPRGPGQVSLPPNLALSEDSATELSAQSGITKCASNKKPTKQAGKAFHGNGKPQIWGAEALNKNDTGTAARYFHQFTWCRKANKVEKDSVHGVECPVDSVKPEPLIAHLVKLVTPPGGRVLDPFAGSGTTLKVARRLGFEAYGIEKKKSHYTFAKARCGAKEWSP